MEKSDSGAWYNIFMNANKGLAPILWVIIAAILVGGGYFAVQISKSKMENAELITEQAVAPTAQKDTQSFSNVPADWNTYRNDQYGFEFKYPAEWRSCLDTKEGSPESFRREHPQGSEIFCFISNKTDKVLFVTPTISGFIRNDLIASYPSYTAFFAYHKNQAEHANSLIGGGFAWVTEDTLGNQAAFDDCFGDAGWSCDKFFLSNKIWFAIRYTDSSDSSEMITKKIFSTFRFTK